MLYINYQTNQTVNTNLVKLIHIVKELGKSKKKLNLNHYINIYNCITIRNIRTVRSVLFGWMN